MGVIESAVDWACRIANDNSHGYDQIHRQGPDYDCSSFVINAYQQAGVPVKANGASYTGNMKQAFLASGFYDVTSTCNLKTGDGMQEGDVLLVHSNKHQHTAIYLGGYREVEASINEKGTATGGKTGDQTGREILIRPFRPSFYTTVLRYDANPSANIDKVAQDVINGKYGNGIIRKRRLEARGYNYLQVQKRVNEMLRGR